ncbi:MAG: S-layer homology domain-containing protein [Clostridia bacterium]|nr:S-layer homology domain-containing protein [Clostridia bacterium]
MKYRLFVLLLSLTLLCSGMDAAAQATDKNTENIFTPMASQEFDALSTMGLLPEDFLNMSADEEVSRAQFTGALYKLAGFSSMGSQGKILFTDVNINTPHKDAIVYFYNIGIVNGYENNTFLPDNAITYSEAIKIAVNLLGYKNLMAGKYGVYPGDYFTMAQELKLTKGIKSIGYNEALSGAAAVKLLYNCGVTCLFESTEFGSDGRVSYKTDENRYLLSVYNNIYYDEGIMKNNGIVSLSGDKCREDSVVISGIRYETADADFSEFIGQKVKYFYRSVDGIDTLLWLAADEDNKIITVKSEELYTEDSAYSLSNIVYFRNNKKASARISKYADIIYNNTVCNDCGVEQISPRSGSIKLIDSDGDNTYDTVIVSEFKNIFAAAVSADGKFILDKYGNTVILDDYENVKILKNGSEIQFGDIPNNCVISLIESLDKQYLYLYVNDEGTTEVLQSVSDDGSETYYTFESGKYLIAGSLEKIIADGYYTVPKVRAGNRYKYFLDISGNIAALEEADGGSLQYAYLIKIMPDSESFDTDGRVYVRLVLKDGTVTSVITADKIKLDGTSCKKGADLLKKASSADTGEITPQVVRVAFNGDGEIKEIEFAANVADYSEYGYYENDFTMDYASATAYYMSGNCCMFNSKYCINGNTVCFAVYEDAEGNIDYGVIPFSGIANEKYYDIKVYDCDRYFEAGAISIDIKKYGNELDGHILVDEIKTILHTDGEVYKQIIGYNFGKKVAYRAEDDGTVPDSLKRGDIIRISLFNNIITGVTVVCSLSEKPGAFIKGNAGDEFCQVFGTLYSNNGRMIVTENPEGSQYGKLLPTSAWGTSAMFVPVYDCNENTITIGSVNSSQQISSPQSDGGLAFNDENVRVFIYRRYNYVKELIVAYY